MGDKPLPYVQNAFNEQHWDKPMNAPHLLHVFSNFVPTGPELRTVALIGAFGGEFRHSILSMDGRVSAAERLPAGVEVRLLPSPPRAGSLATARRLRRLLLAERPDLVLTYNWGAFDMLLAARAAGFRRLVHHEEGFNEDEAVSFKRRRVLARPLALPRVHPPLLPPPPPRGGGRARGGGGHRGGGGVSVGRPRPPPRRLALPGVHRLVVPSQRLRGVATGLWKLDPERVRLIPNGIHLEAFQRADGNPGLRRR